MAYIKGLFVNGVGGLSLGRMSFLIVFALTIWAWSKGQDIPNSQLIVLLSCFGYVWTGKFRGVSKHGSTTFDEPEKLVEKRFVKSLDRPGKPSDDNRHD